MNYDDLIKSEGLKKVLRIDWVLVERLIIRAKRDLEMAKKNLRDDEPTAMDLVYKSMFHAANALIQAQGYRPGKVRQHVGTIEAIERTLGLEIKPIIRKFDRLRQKRNEFEYQGLYRGTRTEIRNSFVDAGVLIGKIENYIQEKHPQRRFKF